MEPLKEYLNSMKKDEKYFIKEDEYEEYKLIQRNRIDYMKLKFASNYSNRKMQSHVFIPAQLEKVNSLDDFYLIETSIVDCRTKFQQELATFYGENSEPFHEIKIGDLCVIEDDLKWYRGLIKAILRTNIFLVYLIDFGREVCGKMKNVRVINEFHASIHPFVLKCKLVTLHNDFIDEKEKSMVLAEFLKIKNMLVMTSDSSVVMIITDDEISTEKVFLLNESYGVFIRKNINIPAVQSEWLNEMFKRDLSIESIHALKFPIKISHTQSPSEIFIKTHSDMSVARKLREEINAYIGAIEIDMLNSIVNWNVGDQCLVQYQKPKMEKLWCRGFITKVDDDSLNVFLRDIGIIISIQPHEAVIPITEELASLNDCVRKCHLAISKQWPISCKHLLDELVAEYKYFSVNYGFNNEITLWAKNSDADSSDINWDNIGLRLISKSIRESLDFMVEKIQYRKNHPKNNSNGSDTSEELEHNKLLKSLVRNFNNLVGEAEPDLEWLVPDSDQDWPPALPLQLPVQPLRGIVTHVTETGIIHFLEESDCAIADDMSNQIKAIVESQIQRNPKWNWRIGDICFSKYEEDAQFYRAKIVDINFDEDLYKVDYVDYGNESAVGVSSLYVATEFEDIPTLSNKFIISGVVALNKNGKWFSSTLEAMRAQLINAICSVHIENARAPIPTCSIEPEKMSNNIYEWMIRNQMGYGIEISPNGEQILYV